MPNLAMLNTFLNKTEYHWKSKMKNEFNNEIGKIF